MRRFIRNTSLQSVGNGDQIQPQCGDSGHLKVGSGDADVLTVTFTLDTSAYANGDLLADTQAIGTVTNCQGGRAILDSLTLVDEDAQGVALTVIIASASTSMGTENSAPNISDANARNILGIIPVATTDYVTISGTKVASIRNIGLLLEAAAASQILYVALLNGAGTPTFTATGVTGQFGFRKF